MRSKAGYAEIVAPPDVAHRDLDFCHRYSNLVDAGIILQIGDRFVWCFSCNNGFGIPNLIQSQQELESDEDIANYQLIEV